MSSYHINNLDNYSRTYSFLPNNDKDENGENLMTQSLVVQAPYRRIRHPELVPVIINRDERTSYDIMSQSLIVPPYRRTRHTDLTPVIPKEPFKENVDVKNRQNYQQNFYLKAPKRAFSMTRLDQLARPRQRYLEEALKLRASVTKENLCSSAVRPTSSMSLASKQTQPISNNKSANTSTNSNNSSSNSGTILLRQRSSARKRPTSYAGYSLHQNLNNINNKELINNSDSSSTTTFSRSFTKTKPFGNFINNNSKNLTNLSSTNSNRNLMVSSIDGSMMISTLNNYHNNKPIPPRKPAHIKAVSTARKLAKQQQPDQIDIDQVKKSESTSRINNKLESNILKGKMKKSVTNPERMAQLFDEKLNLNDDQQQIKKVIKKDAEDRFCDNLKSELLDTMSTNTFIVDNESDQTSSNQLIDLNDEQENHVNKLKEENEINSTKSEEEFQKQALLEKEELERKAQEEERRRLAREEKERELERKAKEKIEKARLEMEERLKKDEQERIERKKRLDAIMSRTRKNPGNSTNNKDISPNAENAQQQIPDVNNGKKYEGQHQNEQNDSNPNQNPDVVEDAIQVIKLTNKNENNLNSNTHLKNGKSTGELHQHSFIENETALITESKNISLINGFKEMKMSTNSTFVFSQQTSTNETFAPN